MPIYAQDYVSKDLNGVITNVILSSDVKYNHFALLQF